MPNLNLKGDAPKAAAPTSVAPARSGGGAAKALLIAFVVVAVLGAAAYFLNKAGVVKLWGKKKPVPTMAETIQPTPMPETTATQTDTAGMVEFKDIAPAGRVVVPGSKPALKGKTAMKEEAGEGKPLSTSPLMISAGEGRYTVQVSSWASEEKAAMEADVMKNAGLPAFVEKGALVGQGSRYRVCVGRYPSSKEARVEAEKVAHMLESGYLVVRLNK